MLPSWFTQRECVHFLSTVMYDLRILSRVIEKEAEEAILPPLRNFFQVIRLSIRVSCKLLERPVGVTIRVWCNDLIAL